ncbi:MULTISPECIES: ATP synthase subunit I [unclassified Halanaerobium]|uniref:ATP synthase subunit I n=1 Tax=unclassified Halanaerobium TaxID=2641197 RepID=UPI000DF495C1|nr:MULTISPECIES: ATP synthase subunit I [unclassified Halanaerobium]RCW48263.1 ATP synthase I subunit [Halanaerobium sp. MA284_MarDTE_T2]RCW85690.1 ATP synthase I subunit [Halanaerobium sp. DL-01]
MKEIQDPVKMQKEIIKKTYLISLFPIISSLIAGSFDVFLGFIFGLIISTLLLRIKYNNIRRALDMNMEKAEKFIRNRYFIEYALYFIVLFTSARNTRINFLAAAVGLFMMKFTVVLWSVIDLFKDTFQSKIDEYK